ncbi:MAG TPA: PQQ-binding-like beta-propeller repeat protein [Gemmataceae bacterium]|nr:PQQ-binding-like beta-propeller repeat protein [Gemmataceae bacterium]
MTPHEERPPHDITAQPPAGGPPALPPGPPAPGVRRQLSPWVLGTLLVGLVLLFGFLTTLHLYSRTRFTPDADLLAELQGANFLEDTAPPALPGPWPQWRGPRRDGVSPETVRATAWPEDGPPVLWEKTRQKGEIGDGYSSLAVAGGRVCTLTQLDDEEAVVCWQADTGKELWRRRYAANYRNDYGDGPRSTPAVDGDRVYTVGGTGMFHCLDAETGAVKWSHDLLTEFNASNLRWGVSFSPLIEGDLVLTNPGGPNGKSVVAFDKHTGKVAWSALDDPAGYSSPVAIGEGDTRQVVFFTGKRLVGLSPRDGKLLWDFPWETSHEVNAATPVAVRAKVGGQEVHYLFISSGYGKGCALVKVWPAAKDSWQARRVYEGNQMLNHFSSCVRWKDQVYGFSDPGVLTCLDLRTGKVLWTEKGFKKGSLLAADGYLILLGENGKLALAEATPEGYREKALCSPMGRKCWVMPVLANGRLYLRDEDKVVCLDLGGGPSGPR